MTVVPAARRYTGLTGGFLRWARLAAVSLASLALSAVSMPAEVTGQPTGIAGPSGGAPGDWSFVDRTALAGVDFVHRNGAAGDYYLPETMGSGVAILDLDVDGHLDLYFQNAGRVATDGPSGGAANALFRSRGPEGFSEVGARAGLSDPGYGMGVAAADYDGDGFPDLYLTNYGGPNRLYRNHGDGTFGDVTDAAGVGHNAWSTSATFSDLDGDGFVDLYVANYVDFHPVTNHPYCGYLERDIRTYCTPEVFRGLPDVLYRNTGRGTFRDASHAGIDVQPPGKGLGVVAFDAFDDGKTDLYVANDQTMNLFFRNLSPPPSDGARRPASGSTGPPLRFVEEALSLGVGFDADGTPESGMGVDAGDIDGDLLPDLVVSNFSREKYTVYLSAAEWFTDASARSGLAALTFMPLGFGVNLADLDGDQDLDLFLANGHISDNIEELDDGLRHAQPDMLLENTGGRWRDRSEEAGPGVTAPSVSRGSAVADLDRDGGLDIVVTTVNGPARLLYNEISDRGNALVLRLRGRHGNRDGIGARVGVTTADRELVRWQSAASGYLSQGSLEVFLGVGGSDAVDVTVTWPGGRIERVGAIRTGQVVLWIEGRGPVARRHLTE